MKLTTEIFVGRSIKVHGDKYGYEESIYINSHTRVKILCKKHGVFEQLPSSHMNGHGCIPCGIEFSSSNKRMSEKEFIGRAVIKHGDRYDYSLVRYVDYETGVSIVCKRHGIFIRKPSDFMEGKGCPKCGREKGHSSHKSCMEEFICSANKVHDSKYDYSQAIYETCYKKVKIICTIHGSFEQAPSSHLTGRGCPKCGLEKIRNEKVLSRESFVDRSNAVHSNLYDYSLVCYHNNFTKVKIICAKHGVFEIAPTSHLSGHGCAKCSFEKASFRLRGNTEDFIRKSVEVHGNKYDYSMASYENRGTKVKIVCPRHGVFEQVAGGHAIGKGCPKCGKEDTGLKKRSNTSTFVKKAKEVHDNKYDYSLVDYVVGTKKVKIICSKHGIFEQTPYSHLNGAGCGFCCSSKGESRLIKYLKFHGIAFERQKTFDKCRVKRMLPFDFYIPELNVCVEYDGIHHFKPVHGVSTYEKTKNNDAIKTDFCMKNGIKLIRIPYTLSKPEIFTIIGSLRAKTF